MQCSVFSSFIKLKIGPIPGVEEEGGGRVKDTEGLLPATVLSHRRGGRGGAGSCVSPCLSRLSVKFLCLDNTEWQTSFPIDLLSLLVLIRELQPARLNVVFWTLTSLARHPSALSPRPRVVHGVQHQSSQLNQSELGELEWGIALYLPLCSGVQQLW